MELLWEGKLHGSDTLYRLYLDQDKKFYVPKLFYLTHDQFKNPYWQQVSQSPDNLLRDIGYILSIWRPASIA